LEPPRMSSPADRLYSPSHEWHQVQGDTVTLGITTFAVTQLTDVTYLTLKPKGTKVRPGQSIGEVESVKTTSDIYSAVEGEITDVNQAAVDNPALLNGDAFATWLVKVKVTNNAGLSSLMKADAYDKAHPSH
jgi:glycine cleavage system H protein